ITGRVEFLADAFGARVERADNRPPHRFPDDDQENRDGEEDIGLRIAKEMAQQLTRSASARSTAVARLPGSAAEPVTFSVTERATSVAMPCISERARCLGAAMCCSASAVWRARV